MMKDGGRSCTSALRKMTGSTAESVISRQDKVLEPMIDWGSSHREERMCCNSSDNAAK